MSGLIAREPEPLVVRLAGNPDKKNPVWLICSQAPHLKKLFLNHHHELVPQGKMIAKELSVLNNL